MFPAVSPPSSQESWETLLGVPKPRSCNLRAACCSVATPSVPVDELLRRAAEGDETCRDFLSVFVAHLSPEAAKAFYHEDPSHIDRVMRLVRAKSTRVSMDEADVTFYHCQYLDENRRCQVYEDRPTFCRDYPASPMAILVKGCGYTEWVEACKQALAALGYEIVSSED
jgi:Fe-S-cluster containining protein